MGIPSFYRWLVDRYPLSVIDAVEDSSDSKSPNPNGIEFDNLYLDMNGIIHPCFHPEQAIAPTTYDQVFHSMFNYIDRLFSIVRPRKLLFFAIDGVAPRAKMNQQRARRFRASKDLADQKSETSLLPSDPVAHVKEENDQLDSNIITPGTEFMELLSSALQYYVHLRMNNDPGWKGIKVILSDASVPGEGEHKIVSYIRLQRNLPGFNPNTRHCLYGLDADLIMLALATHEVHFTVLREEVKKYPMDYGKGIVKDFDEFLAGQVFQLVRIWVLRSYLAHELQIPDPNVFTDFERLIDDFIFMCIFVGNDFLPHIPSLEIGEGAIDLLMFTYKKEFVRMGGYLTMTSEVNLERVELFIKAIGEYEIPIFRKRNRVQKGFQARGKKQKDSRHSSAKHEPCKTQAQAEDTLTTDKVKLGEDGWRERYYALKFEVETDEKRELIRKNAVNKYVEGICWVMHYYYQGVCSWNWFYPYHYAPFASDFQGIGRLEILFDLGKPFKPLDQLMGVLPAASAQALPFSYRQLMTDPSSPILDFYPEDFEVDLNGRRHSWQGVCKLPFIDEFRLLTEISKVQHTLTDSEVRRNSLGQNVLFINQAHPLATLILSFWEEFKNNLNPESALKKEINPVLSGGMNGDMYIPSKAVCLGDIDSPIDGMEIIKDNKVISVTYEVPSSHPHISKLPEGLIMPATVISKDDVHAPAILWHESTTVMGSRCSQRPKPPNSILGPCLAKIAHRLVLENCVTKNHEVVSEMWQRWLNRGESLRDGSVKRVVTENFGNKNHRVVSERSLKRLNGHGRLRDSCDKKKRKNNDTSIVHSVLKNQGEKSKEEGKLSVLQERKRSEMNNISNDETNKVTLSVGQKSKNHGANGHGEGEKSKEEGKLSVLQERKRSEMNNISNDETNKVTLSVGQKSKNHGANGHGEGEKSKKEGKLSVLQKRKRSEMNNISNDETNKVTLSVGRKKRRSKSKRSKMDDRSNDETSKVQSSLENHGETNSVPFACKSNVVSDHGEKSKKDGKLRNAEREEEDEQHK